MLKLDRFSFGVGDRFGHQGCAQLAAFIKADQQGVSITPVWNKSDREHTVINTRQTAVRAEADQAVKALGWKNHYFVDADHIHMKTIDRFIHVSDFFTLDVADFIGQHAPEKDIALFVQKHKKYAGNLKLPFLNHPLSVTPDQIEATARKYLRAVKETGQIYHDLVKKQGQGTFITEVSMDETQQPQTPVEILFILAALAEEGVPAQTIAPKFSGRFNKGIDYVGEVKLFAREFEHYLAVIAFAVESFGLPDNLKLSVHSGSDKFSLYPVIRQALNQCGAGLHLKTAGTTWLEELIGLAEAGNQGLDLAKEIYRRSLARFEELCGPYATVIDIDRTRLPSPEQIAFWNSEQFAQVLRHNPACPSYNPHVRQLLHIGYKIAAEMGTLYLDAIREHETIIARNVTDNIFDRHMKPLFLD